MDRVKGGRWSGGGGYMSYLVTQFPGGYKDEGLPGGRPTLRGLLRQLVQGGQDVGQRLAAAGPGSGDYVPSLQSFPYALRLQYLMVSTLLCTVRSKENF